MTDLIKKLRNAYERLMVENATEAAVKYHIITEIFLKEMGYDRSELKFEVSSATGYQDIVAGTEDNLLTIETKAPTHKIEYSDIEQIVRYLLNNGRAWGLLTNGKEYFLLNTKIETGKNNENKALNDTIVFKFDIYKYRDKAYTELSYFKYLSYENIFSTKITNFFKDIQQFKIYCSSKKSWIQYKSTLYAFFEFLIENGMAYREQKALELINVNDFNRFIRYKIQKRNKPLSGETIKNNWSHVSSMMNTLKNNGFITYTHFSISRNPNLEISKKITKKKENHLTTDNIKKILAFYGTSIHSARNMAAFLLCLSLGFERSDIVELKWSQIDLKKGYISIGERNIKCKPLLNDCLHAMHSEKTKCKNRSVYVFCTKRNNHYEKFKNGTLNDIFNSLTQISSDSYWSVFSPKYVKNWAVNAYFEANYPLDEIIYTTASEIKNLEPDHITTEAVYKRIKKSGGKLGKRKQIFGGLLETKLSDWQLC